MKKAISLVLSVMIVISIFAGLNITVNAEETTTQDATFPYSNASTYVADSIIRGVIDREGIAHGSSETSLALLHSYTYHNIAEELVGDELLVFDSLFWQNLKSTLSGDFLNITNWQEEMYILLIIDYLNYYSESDEFKSNYAKNTIKFTENIYKTVIKYADSEYLDNVDEIIKNQSLSDAVAFSNKWGIVDDLKKYNSILGDIETVSKSATEYYKNLTKALSVQKADEARIEFLKQMKRAGSDNYYFVTAVDNVISMYESSYGSLAFSQGAQTMLKHGMSVLFSEAKKACPEAAAIIDGLKIYTEGLNWLFNSDDISKNNLKLIIVYTIGSYAGTAMRNLRDTYQSNPTEDNARAFINGYLGYLKYQEYASNSTIGFVSSALFDGVVNQIINCFSDKNSLTYNEFKEYFHNDISFCQSLEKLVQKHYDLYYAFIGYNATTITDDDPQDNLTEVDPNTTTSDDTDLYDIIYQLMISGNTIISKNYTLTNDLTIYGDLYLNGGTLDLNGFALSVGGNVIQSSGKMFIDGGTLEISGDYRIQSYKKNNVTDEMEYTTSNGYLTMIKAKDRVIVHGDFVTQSEKGIYEMYGGYDYNRLTEGVMEIGGDFKQLEGVSKNFSASNNHKVILNGENVQHVYFNSYESNFNILESENDKLFWSNYMNVNQLNSDFQCTSEQMQIYNLDINNHISIINNDVSLTSGVLDINHGKLSINGSLLQPGGKMFIDGGTLEISGDYRIQAYKKNNVTDEMEYTTSNGYLTMIKAKDRVIVHGDFVTQSGKGIYEMYGGYDYNRLTEGVMEIGGDFKQLEGVSKNFSASNNHTVILNGDSNIQIIDFKSSDCHFNNLKLTKDKEKGYVFNPDNCWNTLYFDTDINSVIIISDLKSLRPMDVYTLYAKVEGINKPSQEVIWQLSGNTDNTTTIDEFGIVTVGEEEKADKLTITATSVADNTKSGTIELSIIRPVPVVLGVRINPSVVSAVKGEKCQFEAITYGLYKPSQDVAWSVSGNTSSNTTIDSNGLLNIANDETAEMITVTATSTADPTKSASVAVDIYQIKITSTVSNVIVTMATGETQKLQAVVTGTNNPNQKVIWSVGGNESANTVINENGELTVGNDETANTIIVRATSVEDPEKYGEFAINIATSDEPQYQVGDTNLDGYITISDVTAIQRHLAEIELLTEVQLDLADTNGDGEINISDATHLQKYLAGFDGIVLGKT